MDLLPLLIGVDSEEKELLFSFRVYLSYKGAHRTGKQTRCPKVITHVKMAKKKKRNNLSSLTIS